MNKEINRLTWDSDFFGFDIGQINSQSDLTKKSNYNLLVYNDYEQHTVNIDGFELGIEEEKIFYCKKIDSINQYNFVDVFDNITHPVDPLSLYSLAFESGKYSRFNLDENFGRLHFENLYEKWVNNAINDPTKHMIYYIKNKETIVSFVILNYANNESSIGLISTAVEFQGQGYGKTLIRVIENFCLENGIKKIC